MLKILTFLSLANTIVSRYQMNEVQDFQGGTYIFLNEIQRTLLMQKIHISFATR